MRIDSRSLKSPDQDTVLMICALTGSILYISLVFNDNLWMDEAFTASLIRGSFSEVITKTVKDTLPPFYNVSGWLLTLPFGFSSLILKLFSCLPMVLLLFTGGQRLKSIFNFRTAFLYELFLITMPNFLHYGVEIRMYSWGVFAAAMAGLSFAAIIKENSSFKGFALFTVLSGYIHHFALVSCGMLWFILLLRFILLKNIPMLKKYGAAIALTALLYFPGLLLSAYQIKNASSYFTMAPLSLYSLFRDLRFPFVTNFTPLSAILLMSVILISLVSFVLSGKSIDRSLGFMLISGFLLTLFFAYGVSFIFGRSLFTARYLVPSLGLLWMGIAIITDLGLNALGNRPVPLYFTIALIVITGVTDYRQAFREEYHSGVETMKDYFSENAASVEGCIISDDDRELGICLGYYFPDLKVKNWDSLKKGSGKFWFIRRNDSGNELEKADRYGYNSEYIGDFSFDRYSFSLYELKQGRN